MIRRLIILLLIVGCVFADTVVYNNDILMLSINKIFYNLLKIKFKSDSSASRIEKTEIL